MHAAFRRLKAEVEEGKQGLQAAVDKTKHWRRSTEEHQASAEQSAGQASQLQVCTDSHIHVVCTAQPRCSIGSEVIVVSTAQFPPCVHEHMLGCLNVFKASTARAAGHLQQLL